MIGTGVGFILGGSARSLDITTDRIIGGTDWFLGGSSRASPTSLKVTGGGNYMVWSGA